MRLYEYFVCGNNLVFPFYGIYLFLGVVCSMMLNTKVEYIEYGISVLLIYIYFLQE